MRTREGLAAVVAVTVLAASCGGSTPDEQSSPPQTDALGRTVGGEGELTTAEGDDAPLSEEDLEQIAAVEEAGNFEGAIDLDDFSPIPEGFDNDEGDDPDDSPSEEGDPTGDTPSDTTVPFEPGGDVPELGEVLETIAVAAPCDLFDADELGTLQSDWAQAGGLLEQLNSSVGADGPIIFDEGSGTETQCDWFSNSHLWLVGVSWEPADPTFLGALYESLRNRPGVIPVGDGAGFVTDGTTAQLSVDGLFITVTNVMPAAGAIDGSEELTVQLAEAVIARIRA